MKATHFIYIISFLLLFSCTNNEQAFDATGTFEAEEVIISAKAAGEIKAFRLEEGETLKKGACLGYVDSTQLYLKVLEMQTQIKSMLSKRPNVAIQLAALKEKLLLAQKNQKRTENLVKRKAASQKSLDNSRTEVNYLKKNIEAMYSSLTINVNGIVNDASVLNVKIDQLKDQLNKCKIVNPMNGVVLTKYAYAHEQAFVGKPLYKIADLSSMILRVYITNDQLAKVRLNQEVKVATDDGAGGYHETTGVITWICSKAEFTPKTIQTKKERENLVYALKIKVKNEGLYKIGMYGQISL